MGSHVSSWVYKDVSFRLLTNSLLINNGADKKVGLQGLGFLWQIIYLKAVENQEEIGNAVRST